MFMLTPLEKRLVDIAYELKLSHLSAYFTAVELIDHIYTVKEKDEPFILSQGHAFAALAVVLEKHEGKDAMELVKKYMTHPTRCDKDCIDCSTGSLGQGLTVAVGMALADRSKNVYVLTSDGEMTEGACWEALRVAGEQKLENLRITVNANSWSAYNKVDTDLLDLRMQYFYPSLVIKTNMFKYPDWLQGVEGHYQKIDTEDRYKEMLNA
jgi:transketolase N-terminal domain/subunit